MIHTPCFCGSIGLQEVSGPVTPADFKELLPRLSLLKNQRLVILFFNKSKGFPGIDQAVKILIGQASAPPQKIVTVAKGFPGLDYEDIFVAFRKVGTPESARLMDYYLSQEQWRELRKKSQAFDVELEKFLGLEAEPPAPKQDAKAPAEVPKKEVKPRVIPIQVFNQKVQAIRHRNQVLERMAAVIRLKSEEVIQNFEQIKKFSDSQESTEEARRQGLEHGKQRVIESLLKSGY